MARRSACASLECFAPAVAAGVLGLLGVAAWAMTPAAPMLSKAAALAALSVLTAAAANGFISFVLLDFWLFDWGPPSPSHRDKGRGTLSAAGCGQVSDL